MERNEIKNVKYYNPDNSASGGSIVTINHESGVAEFTASIAGGATTNFTIISDRWNTSENLKLMLELEYNFQGVGEPAILNYGYDGVSDLVIRVKNHDSTNPTDYPIIIKFARG